ncbi:MULTISPECIES: TetR/AcrR family transcriptional regulator [unclassified Rhodococcus (in: high G+C Gram-positive bacteria)]|uniref:TetR/AcrR family transcriptional regulator n=1 Tax=unclassified Rhodococcus (in: high G+C Gram-positive bacteria) TaxID=192944 RepID=UPI001C9A3C7E|nr:MULTISPECIES: TetR/AcrR family transcriptional regulator [unclassified Rhodococcus (in: high G+C Gram-positive bacteria)]MBY6677638.1 TetR/AcrR family transcriptional regulator [Rhodococcus sp. BP-332]
MSEPSTRDRILIAAATMVSEDPGTRLSVRAVAARAGVSTGSLRHFFPNQRVLMDEVAAAVTGLVANRNAIDDAAVPAETRLLACMQQVLSATGTGEQARDTWRRTLGTYLASELDANVIDTYLAFSAAGLRHIEHWLDVLDEEGALPPGDNTQRAAYLNVILDGLSVARALPTDAARIRSETDVLQHAISMLFQDAVPMPKGDSD